MKFKKLTISKYQQFENIDIDFHKRLTILTWANWSWKSTILEKILAKHSWWDSLSIATPIKDENTWLFSIINRFFSKKEKITQPEIWEIEYDNWNKSYIRAMDTVNIQYNLQIVSPQNIYSFFIPSHRLKFRYQNVNNIPTRKKKKLDAFNEIINIHKINHNNNSWHIDLSKHNSSYSIKETILWWVIQWYWNQIIQKDQELINYYEKFIEILKIVLPKSLWFEKIEIREMEIILVCNNWDDQFTFEQASWWISAIIDMVWKIYLFSVEEKDSPTVIIDEIENHLHPTMQREILPNLLKAFPQASFIVSTHSPLIVWSVKNSFIYALKYNENKKIISEKLDLINQAKNANEILDEVLWVSFSMPIWAEEELNWIIKKYINKDLNKENLSLMRNELKEMGLEKLMSKATCNLIDNKND